MKLKPIVFLVMVSILVSSCGMKRALTLPPKEGEEKKRTILD